MPRNISEFQALDKRIGKKIKARRIFLGISRQVLAEKIGVKQQQLQKYESGMNRISASRLYALAEALNVTVSFFYDDEEKTANEENALPDEGQRLCLEMARNFMKIDNKGYKTALNNLVKILSGD